MENLVTIQDNEPVTTSLVIAEGMSIKHRAVMELIQKYESKFKKKGYGTFSVLTGKSTGGRPDKYAILNEENAAFVISLMRNSEKVIEFKDKLTAEFIKQRKFIQHIFINRQNAEWIEQRKSGKIQRKEETEIIKAFVEYATKQGSENAKCYYMNLTKMENKALFSFNFLSQEYPNLREIMDVSQLITIGAADQIIAKALKDGMIEGLHYKEIYKKAKESIESFAALIGKTALPKIKQLEDGKKQITIF